MADLGRFVPISRLTRFDLSTQRLQRRGGHDNASRLVQLNANGPGGGSQ